jgi:hypothetical protein
VSDHDNRAVWADTYAGDRMRAKRVPDDNVLLSVDGADDVPLWTAKFMESSARGFCSALADLFGVELHAKGTAAKLQEQTTEPLPDDDCRVRVLLQMANEEDASADTWRPDSEKYSEHRARAHNLREATRHIRELEAQVAAFRAPAEAVGYTVSEDGKCWTGNGGGREFVQGPPINVTHGEDPGDYLERIRAGEEPGTVDHLQEARDCLADIEAQSLAGDNEQGAALQAIAHATIADAELIVEHLRFVAESVELQRQALALHQQGQALAEKITAARPIDRLVELPRQNGGVYLIDPAEVSRVESTGPTAIDTWVDLRGHSEEDCMHVGLPCEETLRRLRGETGSAEEGEG